MKKRLFYAFITILLLFAFSNNVVAVKYVNESEDAYFYVNKDSYQLLGDVVQYNITSYEFPSNFIELPTSYSTIYLFTETTDMAYKNKDIWWKTLYGCKYIDYGFGVSNADIVYTIFPDALTSPLTDDGAGGFATFFEHFGGSSTKCHTYTVEDIPEEDTISYCVVYEQQVRDIETLKDSYIQTKNISYKAEYDKTVIKLKGLCNQAMSGADWNDACVSRCTYLKKDLAEWDTVFKPNSGLDSCGFSDRLMAWILNIIKWIKYILPVAVIVLGILDFIKAIGSDKDDEVKKAQGHFVKRLIAAALVFLVPLIIQFILEKMGFDTSCSLW